MNDNYFTLLKDIETEMSTTGVEIPVVTCESMVRTIGVRRVADPVHCCTFGALVHHRMSSALRSTMHVDHLVRPVYGLVMVKRNLVRFVGVMAPRALSVASPVGMLSLSAWRDVPHVRYASS